jgi:hypothetical protein
MKNKERIVTACLLAALLTGCAGKISHATIVGPNADGTKLGFDKDGDGVVDGAFVLSEKPRRRETVLLKTLEPGMEVYFKNRDEELEIPLKNILSIGNEDEYMGVIVYIKKYSDKVKLDKHKDKLDRLRDEFSNQKE